MIMIADMLRISVAALTFIVFMAGCVYWLCSATDLFQFSTQKLFTRLALLCAVSIALVPGELYLVARFGGMKSVYAVFGCSLILSAFFFVRDLRQNLTAPEPRVSPRAVFAIIIVLFLIVSVSLIDVNWEGRLYFSTVAYDWTGRVAITQAITDSGVPPLNPSFHPGQALPLFYYYFWFLASSVCERLTLGFANSRQALIASTFYVAIGLIAIVCLFLRFDDEGRSAPLHRRWQLGTLLLLVTGLDVIPWGLRNAAAFLVHRGFQFNEIESWNSQVTAWGGAVLWVPNHVAALIAAAFLLLIQENLHLFKGKQRWVAAALAGITVLSTFGMSVWMGLMLAVVLGVWFVVALFRGWRQDVQFLLLSGIIGALAFLPFYLDLKAARHTNQAPLRFEVRAFTPLQHVLEALHVSNPWLVNLAYLAVLPLNYLFELGFFAFIAVMQFREYRYAKSLSRRQVLRLVTLCVTVLTCSFVRSSLANNDFGWRAFMLAQLVLLLWAVDLLNEKSFTLRTSIGQILVITACLGVAGTAADLVMLRFSTIVDDVIHTNEARKLTSPVAVPVRFKWVPENAARNFAEWEAYREINRRYPNSAIVQHNPDVELDYFNSLFGRRPVIVADQNYAFLYGIDRPWANDWVKRVAQPFEQRMPGGIQSFCKANGIAALAVRDTDPVWQDTRSWVWRLTPVFANNYTRVFDCVHAQASEPLATQLQH